MTSDLSQYSGDLRLKREIPVENEECPDATEINRWEKILQIKIQNISSAAVLRRVVYDGKVAFESVRKLISEPSGLIDFSCAVLQETREVLLQSFQLVDRRMDCSCAASALSDCEGVIFILFYVQNVSEGCCPIF